MILEDAMIWVDIETTGLDPVADEILEVGVMLTNSKCVEYCSYATLVDAGPEPRLMANEFVQQMHDKSGLWKSLEVNYEALPSPIQAATNIGDVLDQWASAFEIDLSKQPLCGSNVPFDRGFLHEQMPTLETKFHYRNIDISTVKELCRRRAPKLYENLPLKVEQHRAIPDLHDTVTEAAYYFSNFLTGGQIS